MSNPNGSHDDQIYNILQLSSSELENLQLIPTFDIDSGDMPGFDNSGAISSNFQLERFEHNHISNNVYLNDELTQRIDDETAYYDDPVPEQLPLPTFSAGHSHHSSLSRNSLSLNANSGSINETYTPEYLSPTNIGQSNSQNLKTPSLYSNNSLYSDNSTPNSPYYDNVSQVSANQNPPVDTGDSYNYEIALGGSISTANLVNLNQAHPGNNLADLPNAYTQPPLFNFEDFDKQKSQQFVSNEQILSSQLEFTQQTFLSSLLQENDKFNTKLTENNLSNYNQQFQNGENDIIISIQQAPEVIAARTPSLFSNSSANSSLHSRNSSTSNLALKDDPDYVSKSKNLMPDSYNRTQSPGSIQNDTDELLKPDEFQSMKKGRKKSHSNKTHSRSGSSSSLYKMGRKLEEDDEIEVANSVSSREKMLELASPNMTSKRTQKHPSAYACHLCEKRFTRPYNLKSHLRTHTDERPFICNVCGKAFARQHDRKRHEDLHTGEKKFHCKGLLKDGTVYGCGRKFARADALRRHFQTEAGKECIRLLIEEEEREKKINPNYVSEQSEYLTNNFNVPQVDISPPE